MLSFIGKWSLPINSEQCAAQHRPVACNFALYSHAYILEENQKLAPDKDFTGKAIVKAFIASTGMALILSAALLVDRCKWHFWEEEHSYNAKRHQQFYFRLIHIIQRLLHALSDHQLVAGLALLITLNNHACSVTAYHYNLVCTMLILSAVTHLNSLLSIQDYFYKGRVVATYRVIAIAIQCSLSAIVLSGRNTTSGKSSFPSKASSLAIMPAACFLNMNATSYFGFGDALDAAQNATTAVVNSNSTANATAILNDIKSATTSSEGFWEYMLLVAFLLISFFFLIAECFHTHHNPEALKSKPFGWIGISLSGLSIVCSVAVVIIIMNHYNDLRGGMETPQWYQIKAAAQQASSYSEFVTILLVSSASLHGVQAITESLLGHKGRRFRNFIEREYKKLNGDFAPYANEGQRMGGYGMKDM